MQISAAQRKKLASLVVVVLIAVLTWLLQQGGGGTTAEPQAPPTTQAATSTATSTAEPGPTTGGTDPHSGLPWIALADLPPEAHETLELIDADGPYPYDRDGIVFSNRERILPSQQEGYYHEFTVETPGSDDRGARRIVTGGEDEYYWTQDHYQSFERIQR